MATANTKEKCSMCNERMDLFDCRGCNNSFCFSHLLEHRENVKQEFHQIEDNYNSFQQTIIDQKNHPNQHLLIEKINQWENISIEKIKKTAEQCRKELTDYLNKFLTVVTDKSKDLFEELQQINKADKFSEIHLNELKEKLNKLKEELENLKHVSIEEENKSSFIRKLLVNIPIPIDLDTKSTQDRTTTVAAIPKTIKERIKSSKNDNAYANESNRKDQSPNMLKPLFNMDEFKRVYSNQDTAEKAIPYFWKNFDKQNYSIWFCEYKYPEDLTQVFMTCNLVSGFFQRLDTLRKNTFASMGIFGENNNNTMAGVWVWGGQDLIFKLSPDWQVDYESYSWTKLSPDDQHAQQLVNQFLLWEGEYKGKKFNQGKIFK